MATVALPTKKPSLITPGFLAWLAFLGLCIMIGLVSAYEVLTKGLSVTNMSNTVPWGLWITIDLSAIALGAGAFTLSAIVYMLRLKRFHADRAPGGVRGLRRLHHGAADAGHGHRPARSVLASLGRTGTCTRCCGKSRGASRCI